jgi:hypothetical protein
MSEFNQDNPEDTIRRLREIAQKARDARPLDGVEAEMFFSYTMGLEIRVQYLRMALYALGFGAEPTHTPPPAEGGIIFEGGE